MELVELDCPAVCFVSSHGPGLQRPLRLAHATPGTLQVRPGRLALPGQLHPFNQQYIKTAGKEGLRWCPAAQERGLPSGPEEARTNRMQNK